MQLDVPGLKWNAIQPLDIPFERSNSLLRFGAQRIVERPLPLLRLLGPLSSFIVPATTPNRYQ
jgi:hypothetical protein